MQTRPLPESPDARSPAGAEIRYLMSSTAGVGPVSSDPTPSRRGRPPGVPAGDL